MTYYKTINVDSWDCKVYLLIGEENLKKFFKKIKYDMSEDEIKHYDALTYHLEFEKTGISRHIIYLDNQDLEVICHECVHCAWHILHERGVNLTVQHHESLAYLTQYLFKSIVKILEKQKNAST